MKRILLIGENPNGPTGNGLMMSGILNQIPTQDHDVSVFCPISDFSPNISEKTTYTLIASDDLKRQDLWGSQKLLTVLQTNPFDFIAMIGIDIWRYSHILQQIRNIQKQVGFKTIHIFPYDLQYVDREFVQYCNLIDIPCVYSEYGFGMLKDQVPNLRYFRPYFPGNELFVHYDAARREECRKELFPITSPETFVFGFIGPNQIRKDPQKVIKAFSRLRALYPQKKMVLYMHTNFKDGVYNLSKYATTCGLTSGDLLIKPEGSYSPFERMPNIYNAFDCFVNCSMQEGLSWTTIQAMLCGVPVIASKSTAHPELLKGCGALVDCESESYIPIRTFHGNSWIDAKSCRSYDIMSEMENMMFMGDKKVDMVWQAVHRMRDWVSNPSDFNDLTKNVPVKAAEPLIKQILFMQHSSAGDILMTTRCLKRIREKHQNLPLTYMTQEHFFGLLNENPDVQKVIPWNPDLRTRYQVVYNPHGERILLGGFNNLDVKLADMYPYFCKVEPDDFFIHCERPNLQGTEYPWNVLSYTEYVVVHTTGGDPKYRTYAHMGLVTKGLTLPVVQIGSATDLYCPGAIDLRGILTFNETAWVMKNASAAIVIDSFPAHLAGALDTPCIVLYGPAPARVVGPIHKGVPENLWFDMEPNKLDVCPSLTNCHGQHQNCQSPCINSISPFEIKKNLIKILEQVCNHDRTDEGLPTT